MDPVVLLALATGVVHLIGYVLYNRTAIRSKKPSNLAVWTLWTALTLIDSWTYGLKVHDWVKSFNMFVGLVGCVATFLVSLWMGSRFKELDLTERIVLGIGAVAIVLWVLIGASAANYILVVANCIGFIPLYKAVWRNPHVFNRAPWFIWNVSMFLRVVIVNLRFDADWTVYINPMIYLVAHTILCGLMLRRKSPALSIA